MHIFTAEECPDLLPIHDAQQDFFLIAFRNDHINARMHADLRCLDLRIHAARTARCTRAAGNGKKLAGEGGDFMDQLCIRMTLRILRIQALNVGKNNQKVGFGDACDDGRQRVIVADLDLICGYRIIFIHDRDRAKFKKCLNGTSHVEIALRIHRITLREKELSNGLPVFMEEMLIGIHERALPHGRRCLFVGQEIRLLMKSQHGQSHADRPRCDEYHIKTAVLEVSKLPRQMIQVAEIHFPIFIGDRAGTDLHDHTLFLQNRFAISGLKVIHSATSFLFS